ncbi:Nn.00g042350.m01.CDS01 [Neocucurbitaria sp. VM-36]
MARLASPDYGLDKLPNELVLMILDCLSEDTTSAILALNATNRRLHNLTLDRLYAIFPGYNFEKFLRTMALPAPHGCPAHANRVKEVRWIPAVRIDRHILSAEAQLAITERLRNYRIRSSAMRDVSRRFNEVRPSEQTAAWYLDVFLLFVPNVERLVVLDGWQWDDHVYWFEAIVNNAMHFSRLHSVTIHGPLRIENIVPLLTLPSLRSLDLTQVIMMHYNPDRQFQWDQSPDQAVACKLAAGSSLEHLTLRESNINTKPLIPLFKTFRALKSFSYEHADDDLAEMEDNADIDFASLATCLEHQVTSLEHFGLESQEALCHQGILRIANIIHRMPLLRTMELSHIDVLGANITPSPEECAAFVADFVAHLPPALESLTFNFFLGDMFQWSYGFPDHFSVLLTALLAKARPTLPKLRELAAINWPSHLDNWPPDLAQLQKDFADVGIEFVSRPR